MRWASLDSFLVQDDFWQDKMGKPIANKDFMMALLRHGTFESYTFYYLDQEDLAHCRACLEDALPAEALARVRLATHPQLADDMAAGAFDILHQGDFTYHAPYVMELRASRPDAPPFAVSGITHSLDGVNIQSRLLNILLAEPKPQDAIICTSECAEHMLRAAFDSLRERIHDRMGADLPEPPRLTRIPLGLSDAFDTPLDRAACRQALGLPEDQLVLLTLGRFSARRKMDLAPMLECLEHMISAGRLPPVTLILAGGGSDSEIAVVRDIVETLGLSSHVRIEANHSFERKRQLYSAADIFVSLVDNYQETFGLTVIEAMAHGLPTVVAEFNGYRELVANGETGFRIPTYASPCEEPWQSLAGVLDPSMLGFHRAQKIACDMRRFAEILQSLAQDGEQRRALGETGRKRGSQFRWSKLIPYYEALWREQHEAAQAASTVRHNDERRPAPVLVPDHRRVFGHYPSRILDDATRVGVSAYCRERMASAFKPVMYAAHEGRIGFAVMQAIMSRLGEGPRLLGTLLDEAAAACGLTREAVTLTFDFLLKHGYIEVEPAA